MIESIQSKTHDPPAAVLSDAAWERLCSELSDRKNVDEHIATPTGVENTIVSVDRKAGRIVLRSSRSRSGRERTITRAMLRRGATTHGVIVRALLDLARGAERPRWIGPFRLADLLSRCTDATQPWPPDDGAVYLVTRRPWTLPEPTREAEPLYIGSTTGGGGRFCTRVGDLVADMLGFYGTKHGHHSGGQSIYVDCQQMDRSPLDLHLAWYVLSECRRCEELRWHARLAPELARKTPPACTRHPGTAADAWARIRGVAGQASAAEVASLRHDIGLDPALRRTATP